MENHHSKQFPRNPFVVSGDGGSRTTCCRAFLARVWRISDVLSFHFAALFCVCGAGSGLDDGQWHAVRLVAKENDATLMIDGDEASAARSTSPLAITTGGTYHLGGKETTFFFAIGLLCCCGTSALRPLTYRRGASKLLGIQATWLFLWRGSIGPSAPLGQMLPHEDFFKRECRFCQEGEISRWEYYGRVTLLKHKSDLVQIAISFLKLDANMLICLRSVRRKLVVIH